MKRPLHIDTEFYSIIGKLAVKLRFYEMYVIGEVHYSLHNFLRSQGEPNWPHLTMARLVAELCD